MVPSVSTETSVRRLTDGDPGPGSGGTRAILAERTHSASGCHRPSVCPPNPRSVSGLLPVSFSWSDIGSWSALWNALPRDEAGNALRGNVEVVEVRDSLVHADGMFATVVGLENVVVVAEADAVLVASRSRSELVKDLVASRHATKRREARESIRRHRPWGWDQRIDHGSRFQVRRIMVKPGGCLSVQERRHGISHWVVAQGTAEVTADRGAGLLHEADAISIPAGSPCRIVNPDSVPLEMIEVQVGSGDLGDDDATRADAIDAG